MHSYIHLFIHICSWIYMYAYICIYIWTHIHTCMCIPIYFNLHLHIHTFVCSHTYVRMFDYTGRFQGWRAKDWRYDRAGNDWYWGREPLSQAHYYVFGYDIFTLFRNIYAPVHIISHLYTYMHPIDKMRCSESTSKAAKKGKMDSAANHESSNTTVHTESNSKRKKP